MKTTKKRKDQPLLKTVRNCRGEGYVDVVILILAMMLCLALIVKVSPVILTKSRLDTFASELMRCAEISGRVGSETTARENELCSQLEICPDISWSHTGTIQLNRDITVMCSVRVDLGLWGEFGTFPIELSAVVSGKSEVYWK